MAIVKNTINRKNICSGTQIDDVLKKVNELNIQTKPLDLMAVIKYYGLKVIEEEMDNDLSGYIEKRGNSFVIGINKYHNPRRKRFTVAHEFAHYVYNHLGNEGRKDDRILLRCDEIDEMEKEANKFASELLIPTKIFEDSINAGMKKITDLADQFDVSIAAIRYKAYKLGFLNKY